jgi:soluble lytic murein transglycosylase-like protein
MRAMIQQYARAYGVPADLVERVVARESGFNAAARNGSHYGLMQIHPETARTMGYRGPPEGLYDARTNLTYGVKYLRGAWLVSGGSRRGAIRWYSQGYYYEAKRRGLLEETGLR